MLDHCSVPVFARSQHIVNAGDAIWRFRVRRLARNTLGPESGVHETLVAENNLVQD